MNAQYYNKPEYDGFETDYRILDAIEEIAGMSLLNDDGDTDEESKAYILWTNGGDEKEILQYLDENYPDWKDYAPLYWGYGGIRADGSMY